MASSSFIGKSVTDTAGKVSLPRLETNITEPEYEVESPLTSFLSVGYRMLQASKLCSYLIVKQGALGCECVHFGAGTSYCAILYPTDNLVEDNPVAVFKI